MKRRDHVFFGILKRAGFPAGFFCFTSNGIELERIVTPLFFFIISSFSALLVLGAKAYQEMYHRFREIAPAQKPLHNFKNASFYFISDAGFYDTDYDTSKENNKRNERKNLENQHRKTPVLGSIPVSRTNGKSQGSVEKSALLLFRLSVEL